MDCGAAPFSSRRRPKSNNPNLRSQVAWRILQGEPWTEDLLVRGLQDEDAEVRYRFAQVMQKLELFLPEALPVFLEEKSFDPVPAFANRTLPLAILLPCLKSSAELVRARGAALLGMSRNPEAIPALDEIVLDESRAVRDAATEALARLMTA